MVTTAEVQHKLQQLGLWKPGLELEQFELLTEFAPAGALDDIACFRLIDPRQRRSFDVQTRNWKPVVLVKDRLLLDASTEMFDLLLDASRFFARPHDFDPELVFQLHSFALDFYLGYEVREHSLKIQDGELVILGEAYTGGGADIQTVYFETRAAPDRPTRFSILS